MRIEREDRRRGAVLIWSIMVMGLLIAIVGWALDWGLGALVAHQLQNAADAAALAGAQKVRTDQAAARDLAIDVAAANSVAKDAVDLDRNDGNDAAGDIVVGRFDRDTQVFEPDTGSPNAVKVVARRTAESTDGTLPLLFGPIYGVPTIEVEREAIAMVGGGTGAGLIALNYEAKCGLDMSGTVTLQVNDGDVQVNSDHTKAFCANGTPVINAPVVNVNGEEYFVGNPDFEGELNTGAPQIPDPLAWLPEPTYDKSSDLGTVNITGGETKTIDPGYYSGGISQNNGTLTLNPGIYIVDGPGLNVTGTSTFTALGVMFYVVGGLPKYAVDLSGTGAIRITPPDPGNPDPAYQYPEATIYEGVSIFQARDNHHDSRIIGTNLLDLEGTLYFPSNHLEVGGTGDGFGNQLIADTIEIHGTGIVTINYDGRFPAPGNKVFLVR
jgi:hypothetical protein